MKKITLLFALCTMLTVSAQEITTGVINFTSGYSGEIVINATDVTVTFIGPSNLWLGMGFGVSSMTSGEDVITHDSTGFNDRQFLGIGTPPSTDTQDWTVITNDVSGGERTLVVTRPVMGTDSSDYVFDNTATSLSLVWAHGDNTDTFGYHGANNKAAIVVPLTLGVADQALANSLSVFPVPASDLVTVSIDNFNDENTSLQVYSMLGQLVQTDIASHKSTVLDISKLTAGIYLLKVSTSTGIASTKIVKK